MNSEYFEAILQLRKPRDEIVEFIEHETKARKTAFIAKKKKVQNGIDFYMSSQHFSQSLGKKLQQKFGGELKISQKLYSRNRLTSKETYRVSIFFRPFDFKVGDVVKIGDKIVSISALGRKNIAGTDLFTNKKANVEIKDKKIEILEKRKTVVSKTYPSLEVIHPDTYQSVPVKNPKKTVKKNVEVILYGGDVFIV